MLSLWNPLQDVKNWLEDHDNSNRITKPLSTVFATFEELILNSSLVKMSANEDKISYYIDLPGVKKEDLSVCQEGNVIRIRGERKGRVSSVVETQFTAAKTCNLETLQADLFDGVLTISFATLKEERPESRRVEVKVKGK